MLYHSIEAFLVESSGFERGWSKEIGAQPAQLRTVGPVEAACLPDCFGTEIKPHDLITELSKQSGLMSAAAARHQHSACLAGREGVVSEKMLKRRCRLSQFPTISALAVALVPTSWITHWCGSSSRSWLGRVVAWVHDFTVVGLATLAQVQVDNDQVLLSPWNETDCRDGSQPWWA